MFRLSWKLVKQSIQCELNRSRIFCEYEMTRKCAWLFIFTVATCFSQAVTKKPPAQTATDALKRSTSNLQQNIDQLTAPSSAPVVPNPSRYDPAKIEAVNELHDYQIKDLLSRVTALETSKTWIIGLSTGLGIGIAVIVWLRKLIVKMLVEEAIPPAPIASAPPQ